MPSFEFSFDFGVLMSATNEEGFGKGWRRPDYPPQL
jgi:hypothetical protein